MKCISTSRACHWSTRASVVRPGPSKYAKVSCTTLSRLASSTSSGGSVVIGIPFRGQEMGVAALHDGGAPWHPSRAGQSGSEHRSRVADEQRVWLGRRRARLRQKQGSHEERMLGNLDDPDLSRATQAAYPEPAGLEQSLVVRVHSQPLHLLRLPADVRQHE